MLYKSPFGIWINPNTGSLIIFLSWITISIFNGLMEQQHPRHESFDYRFQLFFHLLLYFLSGDTGGFGELLAIVGINDAA